MLDPSLCKRRQRRLLGAMERLKLDAVVVGQPRHVYYLANHRPHWLRQAAFVLLADGRSWLITANRPADGTAADEVASYEAQWNATNRSDQPAVVAEQAASFLVTRKAARIGIDASAVTALVELREDAEFESVEPVLAELRRVKDADELSLMRVAIRCSEAMYKRAREVICPGVPELTVYNELHAAAVNASGEPMSAYLGNDYCCGAGGGPPRKDRPAQAGELYILDLGPSYRGYFADNARAFAVDANPTDAQRRAWEAVVGVFPIIERLAKPGVRCRELFAAASDYLQQAGGKPLSHHLGHGVGLEPHEAPHLNPRWDDVLMEGEVFTAEPGLYGPEINGGIRIENQYLVTKSGVENLTPFPLEMT